MVKNLFFISILLLSLLNNMYAQSYVGINTENPKTTLDINGDLRISGLEEKPATDTEYNKLLAVGQQFVVAKVDKNSVITPTSKQSEVTKIIYNARTEDTGKETFCIMNDEVTKIYLRFNTENRQQVLQLKIVNPSNKKIPTIKYSEKRWVKNNYSNTEPNYTFKAVDYTPSTNYKKFNTSNFLNNSYFVYHIVDPDGGSMFRITASKILNKSYVSNRVTNDIYNYSIICEKFKPNRLD